MAPDLSEKLLGIDIDDADERRRRDADDADGEQEAFEQFLVFELGDQRFAVPVGTVRTLAEVPDEVTRVPRAPTAIEGMMDLRGEITAVIDPLVHFPNVDDASSTNRERLLVLDRPSDEQSAALHVHDVIGVETVPESDVVDETTVEDHRLSGDALEHPLIAALFEQECEPETAVGGTVSGTRSGGDIGAATGAERATGTDTDTGGALSATQGSFSNDSGFGGDSMTLESADAATGGADAADAPGSGDENGDEGADGDSTREVVVTATPIIDLEKLLLASGQRE